MKNAFLIGKRIYLRALEFADAPTLHAWLNDREITRTTTVHRPVALHTEEQFVRDQGGGDNVRLVICLPDNDRVIGSCSLRPESTKDRNASIGIMIGFKAEWDKGYGSEATRLLIGYGFETLNLNRISLRVYEFNPRAIKTYERIGFKHEGVLRQDVWCDGRYWNVIMMGILREEWEALKRTGQ